ncbi:opsin-5-like [Glandiceps talaboti]
MSSQNVTENRTDLVALDISPMSINEDIFIGCYLTIVCTAAYLGNGLVVLHYLLAMDVSSMEKLIINLAISDIGVSSLGYPIAIINSFTHTHRVNKIRCIWDGFSGFTFGLVNIWTVAAIACLSYIKVTNNDLGKKCDKCIRGIVMVIWLAAIFWSVLPILGVGNYRPELHGTFCSLDWIDTDIFNMTYVGVSFCICFFFPLIVTSVCHSKVVLYVRRARKILNPTPGSVGLNREGGEKPANSLELFNHENHLRKIGLIITILLFAAWTPYAAMSLYSFFSHIDNAPKIVTVIPALFAKTSCMFNPLIYFSLNGQFRQQTLRRLPTCLKRCLSINVLERSSRSRKSHVCTSNSSKNTSYQPRLGHEIVTCANHTTMLAINSDYTSTQL